MMDRFLGYFGLSLVVVPIMSTSHFPVNFHQLLKRQTRKSLNEFINYTLKFNILQEISIPAISTAHSTITPKSVIIKGFHQHKIIV